MESASFFHSKVFAFGILPLLIFLSRILDVSIGTMRVIFVSRGYKLFTALFGFFEVLIWIFAITQIMSNLTNILYYTNMRSYNDKFKLVYLRFTILDLRFFKSFLFVNFILFTLRSTTENGRSNHYYGEWTSIVLRKLIQLIGVHPCSSVANNSSFLNATWYYIAYAGGFATGNFVGMFIEEKIALGNVIIRVVSKMRFDAFIDYLKNHNYGVTLLSAQGLQ